MMSYSNKEPQPPPYSSLQHRDDGVSIAPTPRVCCINLHLYDKIRLLRVPPKLVEAIKSQIVISSGVSIQKEGTAYNVPELKMSGYPWVGQGADSVKSRRIVLGIFKAMIRHGWKLLAATDVTMDKGAMDALFFEELAPKLNPVDKSEVDMWAMSMEDSDKIRLIDAPERMQDIIQRTILKYWFYGIQREQTYEGAYEFKVKGNPIWSTSEENARAQILFAQILASVRAAGYKVYTPMSLHLGSGLSEVDTWFFRRVGSDWS